MIKSVFIFTFLFTLSLIAQTDKDRGGGNGYNGRPLESYVKDITQFPVFKSHVLPAIEKVRKKVPSLADDLLKVAHMKNWFFVPVRLPEIPSEKIGVSFKTTQYALQSIGEVWFDDDLYKAMAEEDYRAMILMHELVMGLKLSTLYSGNSYCSAQHRSTACELSLGDYESVRGLSVRLLKTQDKFSEADMVHYLRVNNFGTYTTNSNLKHLVTFNVQDLYYLLISEQTTQMLPKMGRDSLGLGCGFEFKMSRSTMELQIHRTNASGAILRDYLPLKVLVQEAPEIVVKNAQASFQYATPVELTTAGPYRRKLEIFITPERITRIAAYWETYLYNYRSGKQEWTKVNTGPLGSFEPVQRICEY